MGVMNDGTPPAEAAAVLRFWFDELEPEQWWRRDAVVDEEIAIRFGSLHRQVAADLPAQWLDSARGRLAAVIVLDQFSRNLFRDDPLAFAFDETALALARETAQLGLDEALTKDERVFLYVPFQHSENPADQEMSVALYARLGDDNSLDFAQKHKTVIDRFGRFPHRNALLGRESTEEERAFLEQERWFW